MKRIFVQTLAVIFVLTIAGCSTPSALIYPDQKPPELTPLTGKATLVVIRETMLKGSIGNWSVSFDGREISRLSISNYLVTEISPGSHSLSNIGFVESPTLFFAEAGNIYYFNYDLSLLGGNSFEPILPEKAAALIKKYTRVKVY